MRIVQELFTNVHKHAQARRIGLSARRTDRHVEIRIHDDGRGLDRGGATGGRGLRMMANRAHSLGGLWSIGPREGGGTEATLLLPIERPPR
jgi:signal transduction histidine kinase